MVYIGNMKRKLKKVQKLEEKCARGLTTYRERKRLATQKGGEHFNTCYKWKNLENKRDVDGTAGKLSV